DLRGSVHVLGRGFGNRPSRTTGQAGLCGWVGACAVLSHASAPARFAAILMRAPPRESRRHRGLANIRASLTRRIGSDRQTRCNVGLDSKRRRPRLAAMSLKQRLPFLRTSVLRLGVAMPNFMKTGQIGDGREAACAAYVEANARRGDADDVIATIDKFAYE